MDGRDLLILIMTFGLCGFAAAVVYALDDLRMRQIVAKKDDLDRELEKLIEEEK